MPVHMEQINRIYLQEIKFICKKSNLFTQIFNPYEATLSKFAQIKDGLFAHVYKAFTSLLGSFRDYE